ncbi:MAG: vWA domain-containing protein, partial [Bradymonadaceae bacterium]
MTSRKHLLMLSFAMVGLTALVGMSIGAGGCTDTSLYSPSHVRSQADRVALSGRVCTEDPAEANFPMRIVLLVDQASGPLYGDYDPPGVRNNVLRDFLQTNSANRANEFAIIGYAGQPRKHAPVEGNFTRNPGEINNALTQLSNPQGCTEEGQCRDMRRALALARSLIEGDMATTPAGIRGLTQYVIIHINAGPQAPLADGRRCCGEDDLQCQEEQEGPSHECEAQLAGEEVARIRNLISDMGAAGLRYHAIHLAAEPT